MHYAFAEMSAPVPANTTDGELIFMIKVVTHALTAQESVLADLECLRRSNRNRLTDALEQIVQCHLKAFTGSGRQIPAGAQKMWRLCP